MARVAIHGGNPATSSKCRGWSTSETHLALPPGVSGLAAAKVIASSKSNLASYSDAERDLITRALQMAEWNKAKAARILGISRKKLYARITEYGLD